MPIDRPQPIADLFIHVQCAYTSLERWREFGLLDRERPWFHRITPLFGHTALITYGGATDHELSRSLCPPKRGPCTCIANERAEDPAVFQAGVPARVLALARARSARTAVVFTDQHFGGEVGIAVARTLRDAGLRVGLVARGGYHWSWFIARDHGAESPHAALAAAREGELCRAADVVVGSTVRMVEDLAWRHALPADLCRVIPNFVSVPSGQPGQIPREPHAILAAGRLEPQKRCDLLVRAVALLARSRPDIHLTIHGDGSQRETLARLIVELGAPVKVRPRIPQTELLESMRRCAVFVQCSAFEGHPKTIIEALALGTPVVVTRGPGVDDEIIPGVTGLVTRDAPEAVAAAIGSLIDDPSHARRLGDAAARDVGSRLALDAVAPLVERACRDALALNGARAAPSPATVRWDQTLLEREPSDAARMFAGSILAFARRLAPSDREVFSETLADGIGAHPIAPPRHV